MLYLQVKSISNPSQNLKGVFRNFDQCASEFVKNKNIVPQSQGDFFFFFFRLPSVHLSDFIIFIFFDNDVMMGKWFIRPQRKFCFQFPDCSIKIDAKTVHQLPIAFSHVPFITNFFVHTTLHTSEA